MLANGLDHPGGPQRRRLLDDDPLGLPDGLVDTYAVPADLASVATAASAVVALLADCTDRAATRLGHNLSTPWEGTSRERLAAALTVRTLRR